MKKISDHETFPQLVRLDRNIPDKITVATYKTSSTHYTTYKNNKFVGWCSSKSLAIGVHEMLLRVYGMYMC